MGQQKDYPRGIRKAEDFKKVVPVILQSVKCEFPIDPTESFSVKTKMTPVTTTNKKAISAML